MNAQLVNPESLDYETGIVVGFDEGGESFVGIIVRAYLDEEVRYEVLVPGVGVMLPTCELYTWVGPIPYPEERWRR